VKQLSDYNAAFGTFFANLKAAGIDPGNTLFIFTPDEGDHFSGAAPSPANCDGVNVPCTYGVNDVGELDCHLHLAVAMMYLLGLIGIECSPNYSAAWVSIDIPQIFNVQLRLPKLMAHLGRLATDALGFSEQSTHFAE
jgi:hypothetical protein